ncbi:hypothetical protein ABTP43_20485, partial [Acinetobacter baumannii]
RFSHAGTSACCFPLGPSLPRAPQGALGWGVLGARDGPQSHVVLPGFGADAAGGNTGCQCQNIGFYGDLAMGTKTRRWLEGA